MIAGGLLALLCHTIDLVQTISVMGSLKRTRLVGRGFRGIL